MESTKELTLNVEESSFGPMESLLSNKPSVLDADSTLEKLGISVEGTGADVSLSIKDGSLVVESKCDEYLTGVLIDQVEGATEPQRKLLKDSSRAIYQHQRAEQARVVAEKMAAEAEQDKKVLDRYKSLESQSIAISNDAQAIYNNLIKSRNFPRRSAGKVMRMIQVCIDLDVPVERRFFEHI